MDCRSHDLTQIMVVVVVVVVMLMVVVVVVVVVVVAVVNTAHGGRVVSVRFLPDGLRLLTLGTDHRLRLWDTSSGLNTLVNYGRIPTLSRMTVRISISSMESGLAIAFVPISSDIVAFDIEDGQRLSVLRGHYGRVNCLTLGESSPHCLYSGANDRSILVWSPSQDSSLDVGKSSPGGGADSTDVGPHTGGSSGLGTFARRVGGGTQDSWSSDEDS